MNYYFVIGSDQSQHTDMTPEKILNYIYNTSRIMFGDNSLLMKMQTINLENDTQYIVYHPRYTKIVQIPSNVSVVRLDGTELDDGTVYLNYELTYSGLDLYTNQSDSELAVVRDALISTLAEIE